MPPTTCNLLHSFQGHQQQNRLWPLWDKCKFPFYRLALAFIWPVWPPSQNLTPNTPSSQVIATSHVCPWYWSAIVAHKANPATNHVWYSNSFNARFAIPLRLCVLSQGAHHLPHCCRNPFTHHMPNTLHNPPNRILFLRRLVNEVEHQPEHQPLSWVLQIRAIPLFAPFVVPFFVFFGSVRVAQ